LKNFILISFLSGKLKIYLVNKAIAVASLFIIRGELDEISEIQAAKEEFLVLQDFSLDGSGRIQSPNHMAIMMGREGQILTANGQVNPKIAIPSGGLLRLRLLNASASRFYRLSRKSSLLFNCHRWRCFRQTCRAGRTTARARKTSRGAGAWGERTKTIPFVEFAL